MPVVDLICCYLWGIEARLTRRKLLRDILLSSPAAPPDRLVTDVDDRVRATWSVFVMFAWIFIPV